MVNWFDRVLSKEWKITPAGGLTGDAYFAVKGDYRLFLKRNSSPFLAVLSAEGIVPKLVWTKRMENGDVITAQEWLDGRELKPKEMRHPRVASLLRKIHQSSELLHMLMRLGKKPISSNERLQDIKQRLDQLSIKNHPEVKRAEIYLSNLLPKNKEVRRVVCHCDLNHNNVLLSKTGQLYLIDWENAMIADPIIDYGTILNSYIPFNEWGQWLENYGETLSDQLITRMYWYLLVDSLSFLAWHDERNEKNKMQERLIQLSDLIDKINKM